MAVPVAIRLAVRQWRARPLRPVLCSLAIAVAVALIICVGAAMDSLRSAVTGAIGQALGVSEIHVRPAQRDTEARLSQSVLDKIRSLPEVERAAGRLSSPRVKALMGTGDDHLLFDVIGIEEPLDQMLRPKIYLAGRALSPDTPGELVVDQTVAEAMHLKIGSAVPYAVETQPPRSMRVVGIIERPRLELLARPTVYVPLVSLAADMGIAPEYVIVDIKFRETAGIEDYEQYARKLQGVLGSGVEVTPGTTSKAKLADLTRTLRLFLLMLSMLSALCASLIIGTTLSVGVQERVRQYGQLRCIGASGVQLALMLLADALLLLVLGEVLGSALGVGLSRAMIGWFPNFFGEYHLSPASTGVALICGAMATFLGSLIPIFQVMHVEPMAAITAAARPARHSRIALAGIIGAACLVIQVLLWNVPSSREFRVFSYIFVGVPLIFVGWSLLAPPMTVALERLWAPIAGRIMAVRPSLLRRAWSRTPWRAGAMIAALMIGITFLTAVRARGRSLMNSWITPRIPDLVIKSIFGGFSEQRIARLLREHPEIRTVAPFECFTVTMKTQSGAIGKLLRENETTFVAVHPDQFASLVDLDFLQGERAAALEQLKTGNYVLVTEEFHGVRKLGVGDKLTFRAADGSDVDFTIAGVVTSTGVQVVKNYFDLRATFADKAISSVLGTIADGKKYFKLGDPTLMLVTVNSAGADAKSMTALRDGLAREWLQSLSSVEVKQMFQQLMDRIINGLSIIGIGALCVASLGVANMVIASVHARRYELGVLRAIGAGRWQLVRLVLAEVTLIGFIAGILGAAAGLSFSFMATQIDRILLGFATSFIDSNLTMALAYVLFLIMLSIGITTLLAWAASLGPALRGVTAAQRSILAQGRG